MHASGIIQVFNPNLKTPPGAGAIFLWEKNVTHVLLKAGLAALMALGGLGATTNGAAAAGPDYGIYVQYHDRDRGPPPRHGWRDDGPRHGWRDDGPRRGGCAPWMAEDKASRMGLRRARVVDVSRRSIVVVGRDRGGRDRIVFANERGCPVIRR